MDGDIRLIPGRIGDTLVHSLDETTAGMSRVSRPTFDRANTIDVYLHDLQHEATCKVCKRISAPHVPGTRVDGQHDMRMPKRYQSRRGSHPQGIPGEYDSSLALIGRASLAWRFMRQGR